MKRIFKLLLPAILLYLAVNKLSAQGTAFTYQGRLSDGSAPATGNYDMAFSLFGISSGGSIIGTAITNAPTPVTNGLFTVTLDFGNQFNGSPRWLEIRVRTNGSVGAYTTLTPRQQLTPTPYAIFAGGASNATTAVTITGSLPSSGLSGGYTNTVNFNSVSNSFAGFFAGNGAGLTNVPGGFLVWRIYAGTNLFALANTGYVLTSTNFVTVTLPDSTNISDLVRVAGIGTGGWKIGCRTNQNFFVNNLAGAIGQNWTAHASSQSWFDIACSSDGTKLVAVHNGIGTGTIYTSADSGVTWTSRQGGVNWHSVASSSDGTHLLAGANVNAQVWTSSDSGVSWIARGGAGNWEAVASSADGSKLAACSFGAQIYTSIDYGTNWSHHSSSSGNRNWAAIASSADGMKLVAAVTNGFIYTSTDAGIIWTPRATTQPWHGVASSADGVELAACAYGGKIWTSTDSGVSWKTNLNSFNANWSSIASSSDGTKLVATIFNGGVYASGDSGGSWITHSPTTNWWAVCSSDDGAKLAAAVRTGFIYTSAPSFNVTTSGYVTGGQGSAIELLSIGTGQFVPISFMGQIFAY